MKYEKEVKDLLRDLFFESWMGVADYEELITEVFNNTGASYEQLSRDIETGVTNGYTVEEQLTIIKILIKPLIK